jgi:hypothetical protein
MREVSASTTSWPVPVEARWTNSLRKRQAPTRSWCFEGDKAAQMMDGMGWGMGLTGLLFLVLVVLGIAALVKYLMSNSK